MRDAGGGGWPWKKKSRRFGIRMRSVSIYRRLSRARRDIFQSPSRFRECGRSMRTDVGGDRSSFIPIRTGAWFIANRDAAETRPDRGTSAEHCRSRLAQLSRRRGFRWIRARLNRRREQSSLRAQPINRDWFISRKYSTFDIYMYISILRR